MGFKKIFACVVVLMSLNNCVSAIDFSKSVDVRESEVTLVGGSDSNAGCTHNVLRIVTDNKLKYFKGIKEKNTLKFGVENIIDEYCDNYDLKATQDDKKLLKEILSVADNFNKFKKMGYLWDSRSKVYHYLHGNIKSDDLGISSDYESDLSIDLKSFFTYAAKELMQLKRVSYLSDEWFVCNQLATCRLAQYLGISEVVVGSEAVKLVTKSGEKKGLLTEAAEGVYDYELKNKKIKITPEFQREVSKLEVLDIITGEKDHKTYNFTFKVQDGKLVGLTAFDCENCFNYLYGRFSDNHDKLSGLSHMDKKLAYRILSMTPEKLEGLLTDIIPQERMKKLITRMEFIKRIVEDSVDNKDNFLLDEDGWTDNTLEEELERNGSILGYFFKELNLKKN